MTEILLEKIINKLASDNVVDLTPIHEKTISLSVDTIHFNLCFYANNNQIFIFDEARDADVSINVGVDAFWDLLQKNDITDLIREDKIALNGDVKTAQLFVDILKHNAIKERLNAVIPAGVANIVKKFATDIKSGMLKDEIVNTIIQPKVYK